MEFSDTVSLPSLLVGAIVELINLSQGIDIVTVRATERESIFEIKVIKTHKTLIRGKTDH